MKKISPGILHRYAAGKCTPEERAAVDEWFAQYENEPDDRQLLNSEVFNRLDEKMLLSIREKVNKSVHELKPLYAERKKLKTSVVKTMYRAVAGIAAALVAGFAFYI